MVTIAIAAIVASATFTFFVGQQRVYETQAKMLDVQQNVWAAMETVTRYTRAAGTGMYLCTRDRDFDDTGPITVDPPPVGATTPATGLRAFRSGSVVRIPPLWIVDGASGAPDQITVAFGNGSFGNQSDAQLGAAMTAANPTAVIALAQPAGLVPSITSMFRTNEFGLLLDESGNTAGDRGCTLFQITGIVASPPQLQHGNASAWNPGANIAGYIPFDYQTGTNRGVVRHFGQLTWVRFAINAGNATTPPVLTMERLDRSDGPQVLAEGIEDLQVAYGCDLQPATPDGVLTEGSDAAGRANDEWVLNQTGETIPTTCVKPTAVRVTLIARSLTPDSTLTHVTSNKKPAAENGAAGAQDQYRHRVLTTTVYPRN
jgi:hypothetical protein